MGYKVVIDSGGDLPPELKQDRRITRVPLSLDIGDWQVVDDDSFDQEEFLRRAAMSPDAPHSALPSPESFMEAYKGDEDRIYVVTLSSRLSGTTGSAHLAVSLYEEEYGEDKKIHVFDSKSASVGETLIVMKILEYEDLGLQFEEIIDKTEQFIQSMNIFFVLETLETVKKTGRLTGVKSMVATALNIKPVMAGNSEGEICQVGQARGIQKALDIMIDRVLTATVNTESKILGIAHCNALERARHMKEKIEAQVKFKEIFIVDAGGITSMYANAGGIIISA